MSNRSNARDRLAVGGWRVGVLTMASALGSCAGSLGGDEDPTPDPVIAAAAPESSADSTRPSQSAMANGEVPGPSSETTPPGSLAPDTDIELQTAPPTEVENGILVKEETTAELNADGPEPDGPEPDAKSTSPRDSRIPLAPQLQPLPRSRWIKHRRAPRESLAQVAHRYDVPETKLREWNGLGPNDPPPHRRKRLRVRARRAPPPRESVEYTVQEGDTWWTIAIRHGVDSRDLRAYNWPRKGKMQPGSVIAVWIDPVVYEWVAAGPDPVPLDRAHEQRRGGVGIGAPANGILRNGLRVPQIEGIIHLRLPKSVYGTSHAVEQLVTAITLFHERSDYPLPVELGSMSLPRGGIIGQHKSHQSGRDIDIRLLRKPEISTWKASRGSRVQWAAVWELVLAFAEVDAVVIFLDYKAQRRLYKAAKAGGASDELLDEMIQYPGGHGSSGGLIRHEPGHDTHLHVRFGCGAFETECVQQGR